MAAFLDNCRFNPTAGGTTDWTYSSVVTGYQSPQAAGATNAIKYKFIAITADLSQWEVTEGAYNSGTGVFARTTVLYNSAGTGTAAGQSGAGTKINFTTTPQVAIIGVKEDLLAFDELNSFTSTQQEQGRLNLLANRIISFTGTIVETHATNAVTFAVKTLAGNDPTATTPVIFAFPNGSGGISFVSVTSALSITVPSGATLGTSNNQGFRVWIGAFNDSGTVRLAVRVCSSFGGNNSSSLVYNPSENMPASSTLTPAGSSHVFYTTGAAVTSKYWMWLAYATYESGLATAGTWNASPSTIALVGHTTHRPGQIVQVANNNSFAQVSLNNTTTLTDIGISISFTPLSAANLTRFSCDGWVYLRTGASSGQGQIYAYRDSASIIVAAANVFESATTDEICPYHLQAMDKPNGTSAVVYKPRAQNTPATGLIQYQAQGLFVEEFFG